MDLLKTLLVVVLLVVPVRAQEPVNPVLDKLSYATAFVNPAVAGWKAVRSEHPKCKLARLAIAEAVGNTSTLLVKHYVPSPRPCLGCPADGLPSGHTMNSAIGNSSEWALGASFVWGTGALRHESKRHTWKQVALGAFIGVMSDQAGQLLKCGA